MISYSLVLPQDFFYKCLISGMCFCSAVPWSVLIFPFPPVVSGSPPSSPVVDEITKGTDPKMCTFKNTSSLTERLLK